MRGDKRYKTCWSKTNRCEGANKTICRTVHGEKGGIHSCAVFLLITSRASAEETPLYTKEKGRPQYGTVSAL